MEPKANIGLVAGWTWRAKKYCSQARRKRGHTQLWHGRNRNFCIKSDGNHVTMSSKLASGTEFDQIATKKVQFCIENSSYPG